MAAVTARVNGPEGDVLEWDAIDWRAHEDNVRRLRQRIFKATRDGDLKQVRNLQKLMLRNWSNTLLGVRQVTQRNAGRKTAGVDGLVVMTNRVGWSWRSRCTAVLPATRRFPSSGCTSPRQTASSARSEFR